MYDHVSFYKWNLSLQAFHFGFDSECFMFLLSVHRQRKRSRKIQNAMIENNVVRGIMLWRGMPSCLLNKTLTLAIWGGVVHSGDQPNLRLTYFTPLGVNTFFSLPFCVANFDSQSLMCSCGICCYCHVEI